MVKFLGLMEFILMYFQVIELKDMFTKLGYKEEDTMYFHFRIPNRDLDSGLMPLACDIDFIFGKICRKV